MKNTLSAINNRFTQQLLRTLGAFVTLLVTLAFTACTRNPEAAKDIGESKAQKETAPINRHLFPIKVESKWGYIDQTGAVVIAPLFYGAGAFSEGLAPVWVDAHPSDVTESGFAGGKWGYVDHNGTFIIKPQFDDAGEFSEGLAYVVVGGTEVVDTSDNLQTTESGYVFGKIGFIDRTGRFQINPTHQLPTFTKQWQWRDTAHPIEKPTFKNGAVVVQIARSTQTKNQWPAQSILLRKTGSYLSPSERTLPSNEGFLLQGPLSSGKVVLEHIDINTGLIFGTAHVNEDLNSIDVPWPRTNVSPYSEGLAAACKNGGLDHHGAREISNLIATNPSGWDCGFIDPSGNHKIEAVKWRSAGNFSEGLAAVRQAQGTQEFGFLDTGGNFAIKPQFYNVRDFHNGLAAVQVGNKWGYINQTGSFVVNPQYSQASDFINGLALVDGTDYIDATGKYVFRAAEHTQKESGDVDKSATENINGSAFIVNNRGFLVTNHHVVAECLDIHFTQSSDTLELVASDPLNDLALLKGQPTKQGYVRFRLDTPLSQGEEVIAFGYPLSGLLSSGGSVSVGTVSATKGPRGISSLFQFDAAIQPGSSGGPVLDRKGNVVGVVVGKLNSLKFAALTGSIPENVNFAITAATVTGFLTANNIGFSAQPLISFQKDTEELASLAKSFSVSIECRAAKSD